jgi:hypothetical protein
MKPQVRTVYNKADSSDEENSHCQNKKHSSLATFAALASMLPESGCRSHHHFSLTQNMILPTEFAETVTLAQRNPNIG